MPTVRENIDALIGMLKVQEPENSAFHVLRRCYKNVVCYCIEGIMCELYRLQNPETSRWSDEKVLVIDRKATCHVTLSYPVCQLFGWQTRDDISKDIKIYLEDDSVDYDKPIKRSYRLARENCHNDSNCDTVSLLSLNDTCGVFLRDFIPFFEWVKKFHNYV
jgi:hypothetical protein